LNSRSEVDFYVLYTDYAHFMQQTHRNTSGLFLHKHCSNFS